MKNIIITISDDLDLFDSLESAESYLEPWILESKHNFRAYDKNGNVLKGVVKQGKKVKLVPSGEKNVELLKKEILSDLLRFKKNKIEEVRQLPIEELLKYLVKMRGFTS